MFLDHTQRRIFVCCEGRVLSGRGLCDELITRPEELLIMPANSRWDLIRGLKG